MNKVYAILLWFALLFCHNGLFAQNGGVIVTGKVYAEDEPEEMCIRDRCRGWYWCRTITAWRTRPDVGMPNFPANAPKRF